MPRWTEYILDGTSCFTSNLQRGYDHRDEDDKLRAHLKVKWYVHTTQSSNHQTLDPSERLCSHPRPSSVESQPMLDPRYASETPCIAFSTSSYTDPGIALTLELQPTQGGSSSIGLCD